MNVFSLSGLLIIISSLFFGFFVFIKDWKNKSNQIWGLFSVAVSFWGLAGFTVGMIPLEEKISALLWWRITYLGIIFIPVLFYHYVYIWIKLKNKLFLYFCYLWGIFFFILQWTPWANIFYDLDTITYVFNTAYIVRPATPLFAFFVLCWFGFALYSHYLLYKASNIVSKEEKIQINFFYAATAIGFIGGGATFLIPFGFDLYPAFPLLNFLVPLYPGIMAYAILKHHLMNIKVIAAELLAFGLTAFAFVQIFLPLEIDETGKLIVKIAFVAGVLAIGWMLIKSTLKVLKNQKQLADLSDQLTVANVKLKALEQAKTEFISIASHQLRTPLSFIKGTTSMALEGIWEPFNETQNTELKKIYIFNERLVKLVDELLDISRIDSNRLEFSFEAVSLEPIIEEIVKGYEPEANIKKIFLSYQKPQAALPQVKIDVWKIRQVITNLIDNALRYTSQGGITVGIKEENNKIVAWVQDSGIGVSPQQQKLIFERFGRDKEVMKVHSEGMGLGLYLGTQLVKAHKGRLWVESKPGQGSTFYLELPALN